MRRLRVDEVRDILPELDELRPVRGRILASAVPDPSRAWSGSGELGTVGDRLVSPGVLDGSAPELAEAARVHLQDIYERVERAVGSLQVDDRSSAAEALLEASELEERARRLPRAAEYALAADRALQGGEPVIRARILRRLGRILRSLGRLDEAAPPYEGAYELARASGETRLAATAAIGRGNIAVDRGAWDEAERWYVRARSLLEKADVAAEHWQVALDLSIVARRRGNLDAARSQLERAGEIAGSLGDDEARPIVENGWGQLYREMGRNEEACARFREALAVASDPPARVTIAVNLGESLLAVGQVIEAGELGRQAEAAALHEGVQTRLPEVYRLLGRVAEELGHEDAFVFYERAFEIIEDLALPDVERARTLEEYGRSEARAGRPETARPLLRDAASLYRSLGSRNDEARTRDNMKALEA